MYELPSTSLHSKVRLREVPGFRYPPGPAELCSMSSRPHIYRIWGHRGAEPTLWFIILKDKVGNDTSAENHWPRARCWPYPRILSRFRCKVGLQSGGTWFSSGTEQCPRQIGSSRRYRQLCMNRFLPALQRIELRSTDERENHLAFTNHRMTQPAMSVETDRAAWKAGAFLTATRTSHGKSEDPKGSLVG